MPSNIKLTARQALIAAGVTGWCGDGPCGWFSPVEKSTLIAWGQSYQPDIEDAEWEAAATALMDERCFQEVLYPIFEEKVVFCGFDEQFLAELPDPISDVIATDEGEEPVTRDSLVELWESMFDDHSSEWGGAWVYFGMCHGQGSQGPSSISMGPCIGPSCCCFEEGKDECSWGLTFRRDKSAVLPDMDMLHRFNQAKWEALDESDQNRFYVRVLTRLGQQSLADSIAKDL